MEDKIKQLIAELEEREVEHFKKGEQFTKEHDYRRAYVRNGRAMEVTYILERLNNILKGE